MNIPDAIMYNILQYLTGKERLHMALTTRNSAQPSFHACMYDPVTSHQSRTLAISLSRITSVTSGQWKALARLHGIHKRKRSIGGRLSWKEALRPTGCRACGGRTTRLIFGERLCRACTRNPCNKWSYCVPKYIVRRVLRHHGVSAGKVAHFPYHSSSMAHLIRWRDVCTYLRLSDTLAARLDA